MPSFTLTYVKYVKWKTTSHLICSCSSTITPVLISDSWVKPALQQIAFLYSHKSWSQLAAVTFISRTTHAHTHAHTLCSPLSMLSYTLPVCKANAFQNETSLTETRHKQPCKKYNISLWKVLQMYFVTFRSEISLRPKHDYGRLN